MAKELFLIADIGGYTRFMRGQALAHAQVVVANLLEAILSAAAPFRVEKLEGDAVFLHLPESADAPLLTAVGAMRAGFIKKQQAMLAARTCDCDSCSQMHKLDLKFVAHAGEAARQQIGTFSELAGVDVIVVHRLLKNNVPVPEYLLGTAAVLSLMGTTPPPERLDHDLEGIGPTLTYYADLSGKSPRPVPPKASPLKKIAARLMLEARAFLFSTGLKERIHIKSGMTSR
ncbi:MAG: DUF2652 domain-containing protein [Elusimicrobiales bacterium]|nr:DUF2652 domain-containing protein [Elusimicrobiales bacterium]